MPDAAKSYVEMKADKQAVELKAEPMDTGRLDRWLAGKISRRILVVPFGGPVPAAKSSLGVDIDAEWFDADTDIYGAYPALRASRDRLVDWHHTTFMATERQDPVGSRMKGAILGHIVLDEDPEADGVWADFWANAGEKRRDLVAALERRSVPLFGSTQPIQSGIAKSATGEVITIAGKRKAVSHIDVWPIRYHTITTSPQNTYAVMPALKAALADPSFDEIPAEAVKAYLTGLDQAATELLTGSLDPAVDAADPAGPEAVKAGRVLSAANEQRLRALLGQVVETIDEMVRREAAIESETSTDE